MVNSLVTGKHICPGEGQVPLSVVNYDNAEYVSFSTIFVDKRPDNREQFVNIA